MAGRGGSTEGLSVVELLMTTSLLLLVIASVFGVVHSGHGAFQSGLEATDLEQRLRVAAEVLSRELRQTGGGVYQGRLFGPALGPLVRTIPSVLPLRQGRRNPDLAGTFRTDTLTVMYVHAGAAQTTIAQGLPAASATVQLNADPGCPVGDPACGFKAGMTVLVFDDSGSYDLFSVSSVLGSALTLQHNLRDAPHTYPPNTSRIAEATSRTYALKSDSTADTVQLVQYDGGSGAEVPVVDHVVGLSFEYLGDPQPPLLRKPLTAATGPWTTYGPKPPRPGVQTTGYPPGENCVFGLNESGAPLPRLAILGGGSSSLVRLDGAQLSDGPWCPDAASPNRFDADLLRIRSVGVTVRVESAVATLRGPAGALFVRAGTSTSGLRFVPDREMHFEIAPPNLDLGR